MIALFGSLILFAVFYGAQVWLDMRDFGEVEILGRMVKIDWAAQAHDYLDQMADFALAGFALSLFDRVAAHRLSLHWALTAADQPVNLRAAVALGWCILAAAFVLAFS